MSARNRKQPSTPVLFVAGGAHVDRRGQVSGVYVAGASNPGRLREEIGGGAFNAACSIAQRGVEVSFMSVRGGDIAGASVAEAIARAGLADLSAVFLDRATPSYTALIASDGSLVAGLADMELYELAFARQLARRKLRDAIASADAVLLDANLPRFAELNVTAEFSPVGWFPSSFANARAVFGEDRMQRAYNFKGVLEHGGVAVMGTDWPVSSINPWIGFEAMVTRENPFGDEEGCFYGNPISLEQAIRVMTLNGAWCMGIEDKAGSIEVGKSADLIVLDRNLFEVAPKGNIHDTQVQLTLLEGEVTWDRHGEFDGTEHAAIWQGELPNF